MVEKLNDFESHVTTFYATTPIPLWGFQGSKNDHP